MKYAYLLKYKTNYGIETKYNFFSTIENAINFHRNYKHHILKNADIQDYQILVMELDISLNNNELNKKLN